MLLWGAGWDHADEYRTQHLGYVLGLVVVEAAASLATLGLVQRWGEVWPRWLPLLGGRPIPAPFVIAVAGLGAGVVSYLLAGTVYGVAMVTARGMDNPVLQVHGWHRVFMLAHYLPWPLWPVALWVAIVGYARRVWTPAGVAPAAA